MRAFGNIRGSPLVSFAAVVALVGHLGTTSASTAASIKEKGG